MQILIVIALVCILFMLGRIASFMHDINELIKIYLYESDDRFPYDLRDFDN